MTTPTQTPLFISFPFRVLTGLPPHTHTFMGWRERRVWPMGWGCGLPEPLGTCVAEFPDINPYVPALCGATLGRCRGLPGQSVHRPRATRAFPHRGLGAGPDRAEARRHLRLGVAGYPDAVSCMDADYPVHVWGCRCHPGTKTYRRFEDRMISKVADIDRGNSQTTRQLFNSITLGHNSNPNPPDNFLRGLCFRPETRPPPRLHEGVCLRSPLRTLCPGV
jgi:hypothetical protein